MNLDHKQLTRILMDDWGYQAKQVDEVANKLLALSPEILASFQTWAETGNLLNHPVFSEFNPASLQKTYGFKPPAAFLLLEWIRQEPENALAALNEEFGKVKRSESNSD